MSWEKNEKFFKWNFGGAAEFTQLSSQKNPILFDAKFLTKP